MLAALVMAFFSNLFSSMTHYGTGPAPVYFGFGYVEMGDWWKNGFVISPEQLHVSRITFQPKLHEILKTLKYPQISRISLCVALCFFFKEMARAQAQQHE